MVQQLTSILARGTKEGRAGRRKAAGRTITCITGSQMGLDLRHCDKQEVPSREALQVTGIEDVTEAHQERL
ncbi:hypothetical protein LEMLEM_LOCUS5077 [Lemmus lemmus]